MAAPSQRRGGANLRGVRQLDFSPVILAILVLTLCYPDVKLGLTSIRPNVLKVLIQITGIVFVITSLWPLSESMGRNQPPSDAPKNNN